MNQQNIKERILNIERELEFLKRLTIQKPDFDIDEKIWRKIRPTAKKIRKELYQKYYEKK